LALFKNFPYALVSQSRSVGHTFDIVVINYESVHKIEQKGFDCIIVDEFHSLGAFPKPSLRTKRIREIFKKCQPS
jgi:hypothetical protein